MAIVNDRSGRVERNPRPGQRNQVSVRPEDVDPRHRDETVKVNGGAQETYTRQHRQRERYPIVLPARHFFAKCDDGEQVYEITEGMIPHCPECGNVMKILSEVKK